MAITGNRETPRLTAAPAEFGAVVSSEWDGENESGTGVYFTTYENGVKEWVAE